jgi:hypothetical protein
MVVLVIETFAPTSRTKTTSPPQQISQMPPEHSTLETTVRTPSSAHATIDTAARSYRNMSQGKREAVLVDLTSPSPPPKGKMKMQTARHDSQDVVDLISPNPLPTKKMRRTRSDVVISMPPLMTAARMQAPIKKEQTEVLIKKEPPLKEKARMEVSARIGEGTKEDEKDEEDEEDEGGDGWNDDKEDLIDELGMTITFARPCADTNAVKRHLSHATMGAREMKNLDTMLGRMSDRAPSNARLFWQIEEMKTKFGVDTTSYKRLYL